MSGVFCVQCDRPVERMAVEQSLGGLVTGQTTVVNHPCECRNAGVLFDFTEAGATAAQKLAAEILADEAWFNGLDPALTDDLSQPNHDRQQAKNAVALARLVQQNNGSEDQP